MWLGKIAQKNERTLALQSQQFGQFIDLGLALGAGQPVVILVQGEIDGMVPKLGAQIQEPLLRGPWPL